MSDVNCQTNESHQMQRPGTIFMNWDVSLSDIWEMVCFPLSHFTNELNMSNLKLIQFDRSEFLLHKCRKLNECIRFAHKLVIFHSFAGSAISLVDLQFPMNIAHSSSKNIHLQRFYSLLSVVSQVLRTHIYLSPRIFICQVNTIFFSVVSSQFCAICNTIVSVGQLSNKITHNFLGETLPIRIVQNKLNRIPSPHQIDWWF